MAATSKAELLGTTRDEFAKLSALTSSFDDAAALRKRAEDTSAKDVIAHRSHWIGLFLGWFADGQAGKEVHFPAEDYKWNELKRYNAELRARQADMSWAEAIDALNTNYERLIGLIDGLSEAELYSSPMKGARNHWPTGRWAEAAGASHFRSAAKFLRTAKRADRLNAPD